MRTKLIPAILSFMLSIVLSGCAGSASHKVVTAHQAGDDALTCDSMKSEINKAELIIEGVNQDKDDVSGKDVIDGILWFPFNLIAKSNNYNNALTAADSRIAQLKSMQKERGCVIASNSEEDNMLKRSISSQLRELSSLYKDGSLTEEEYKQAKQKILDTI